jgi:hypothetical protein
MFFSAGFGVMSPAAGAEAGGTAIDDCTPASVGKQIADFKRLMEVHRFSNANTGYAIIMDAGFVFARIARAASKMKIPRTDDHAEALTGVRNTLW